MNNFQDRKNAKYIVRKVIKIPRYEMKCRGKRDTIHEIFSVVSRFPHYISCSNAANRLPLGQCRWSFAEISRIFRQNKFRSFLLKIGMPNV